MAPVLKESAQASYVLAEMISISALEDVDVDYAWAKVLSLDWKVSLAFY